MNTIDKDELYGQVSAFLKSKGIELTEGSYSRTIQKGCQLLADTVNLSQQAMERAKDELGKNLDKARQVIHEKTAPKSASNQKSGKANSGGGQSRYQAKGRKKAQTNRKKR